jgi:hypothetical protein
MEIAMSKLRQAPIEGERDDGSLDPLFLATLTKWRAARMESRVQRLAMAELGAISNRQPRDIVPLSLKTPVRRRAR